MNIVFAGTIGRSGLGGQAWAGLQYLLGLRALGHEVYYLEDCGRSSWVYVWETQDWTHELDYPAAFVHRCLDPFGLGDRWIYRDNYRSLGIPLDRFQDICREADLLILRAAPLWTWREEYDQPKRRVFIDVDPGFTQIKLARGDAGLAEGIARAEMRFTYGNRIGRENCRIPHHGGPWVPTVPPVFLPEWPAQSTTGNAFTSILRWQGFEKVEYEGVSYGLRDMEFPSYADMPARTKAPFCLAQMGMDAEELRRHGWEVQPGEVVSQTVDSYRGFIQESRAEFSVPKHGYVHMRGGWFSDRSVCYLASARPVLIEDTGLKDWLPVGRGLLTFINPEQATAGVHRILDDYQDQQRSARRLAEDHFATDRVLPEFLEIAMS